MSETRFIAQDVSNRQFLNWAVPLSDVKITRTLSGPDEIAGTLTPEMPVLNVDTYSSLKTELHLEQDGRIRASGILQPLAINNPDARIAAEGFTSYPHEVTYEDAFTGIQVDPLDMVRKIWGHVQSYPDGNLGVTVDGTASPIRLGTPEHEEPDGAGGTRTVDARPYKLVWWENTNCGREIDALARETPFDYREESSWNTDGTDVLHHLRLGYPRLGRKRRLRFAERENVVGVVPWTEMEDQYASVVVVLGAGEGRRRIRAVASEPGDRLRRVVKISDKSITTHRRAKRLALDELRRRKALVSFKQITVNTAHAHARWGKFDVGDDIPVTGEFPWLGHLTVDHRITSMVWSPNSDLADLNLVPSAAQYYGPPLGGVA